MAAADYERDFVRWLDAQAAALREGCFEALDVENLAEEVEGLARSERREVRERLQALAEDWLTRHVQPPPDDRSWRPAVLDAQAAVGDVLQDSPSLRDAIPDLLRRDYAHVVALVSARTGLPPTAFPADCPYSGDDLLA